MPRYNPDHVKEMKRRIIAFFWQNTGANIKLKLRSGAFKDIFDDMDIDINVALLDRDFVWLYGRRTRNHILNSSDEKINKYYADNIDTIEEFIKNLRRPMATFEECATSF